MPDRISTRVIMRRLPASIYAFHPAPTPHIELNVCFPSRDCLDAFFLLALLPLFCAPGPCLRFVLSNPPRGYPPVLGLVATRANIVANLPPFAPLFAPPDGPADAPARPANPVRPPLPANPPRPPPPCRPPTFVVLGCTVTVSVCPDDDDDADDDAAADDEEELYRGLYIGDADIPGKCLKLICDDTPAAVGCRGAFGTYGVPKPASEAPPVPWAPAAGDGVWYGGLRTFAEGVWPRADSSVLVDCDARREPGPPGPGVQCWEVAEKDAEDEEETDEKEEEGGGISTKPGTAATGDFVDDPQWNP